MCANCGAENPATQKFCGECGTALAAICSSCGAKNPPGQKFCGEEWLATQGRTGDVQPLLAEAREIFERLAAKPWLERLGQTSPVGRETEAVIAGS
jgi:ribosomal protein L40E